MFRFMVGLALIASASAWWSSGGNGGDNNANAKCGISKVAQSRIVNGVEAKAGAWPWIVSLQSSGGSRTHFCGGTILTPNWILTASHCVERNKNNPGYFHVVAGAHDKSRQESSKQKAVGKRVIMHPNYGQGGALNADVALIELRTPLRLNDRVVKACMPQQGVYPKVGKNCYIAGWGTTTHPGNSPNRLQQAKLPVVGTPHRGCHNNREVVCVGLGFGKQSDGKQHPNACRGDSGGPLMCQQSNGSWTVEGVASYVYTYCKYYTAYAPVNKYLPWIKQYVPNL
uniref:Peptidase S1 domain-containing protein n=4 Tax=Clytia hemisphaerica TaxID=252671 RepID=A0A7M5X1N2_9CNID|eukprot:TCONS_00009025-protein